MAVYDSVRSIMNTTENMEHLIVNTRYDGTTLQYPGVDWFQFNGSAYYHIHHISSLFLIRKCVATLYSSLVRPLVLPSTVTLCPYLPSNVRYNALFVFTVKSCILR